MRATLDRHKTEAGEQMGLVGFPGSRSIRESDGPSCVRCDEGKAALATETKTRSQAADHDVEVEIDLSFDDWLFSVFDEKKKCHPSAAS